MGSFSPTLAEMKMLHLNHPSLPQCLLRCSSARCFSASSAAAAASAAAASSALLPEAEAAQRGSLARATAALALDVGPGARYYILGHPPRQRGKQGTTQNLACKAFRNGPLLSHPATHQDPLLSLTMMPRLALIRCPHKIYSRERKISPKFSCKKFF